MKKRFLRATIALLGAAALFVCAFTGTTSNVKIEDDPVALSDGSGTLVQQTVDDINVIPDKYNTGAKGELTKVALGDKVEGIQFAAGSNGTKNVMDFYYRNKTIEGTITIENCDFSEHGVALYNQDKVNHDIKVIFNNCKFSTFASARPDSVISFEFNNCTFHNFGGSNAVFNRCKFGNSATDGMNPFRNVEVNDSFISDLGSEKVEGKVIHSDGMQIYGSNGIDVKNVTYKNCRFEVPPVLQEGSTAGVNSCIMVQMEFSNAEDVSFSDCIVNGGVYSIYARSTDDQFSLKNVLMNGIRVGCAKKYGTYYPRISSGVSLNNVKETEGLYVSSVWKEDGNTHFSVSNDTNQERTLLILTDQGEYYFTIPACKTGNQMTLEDTYSEMPFDIDVVVEQDCEYAICYEYQFEGCASQVRFVNWSDKKVYLSEEQKNNLFGGNTDEICSGMCGKNVTYVLDKMGVLTLSGSGDTYSYNSAKLSPWSDYSSLIKEVHVDEGIEGLGNQLFRKHTTIREVTLPDSLVSIGSRTFDGCTSLTEVVLPKNIKKIGDNAFSYTTMQAVYYEGTDWDSLEIQGSPDALSEKLSSVHQTEKVDIIAEGTCGKNVNYIFTSDGLLRITGTGNTYNYNSAKAAPWYEYREMITSVYIEEGITEIGQQLFRNCTNISQVYLPEGIELIGRNAFISCKALYSVQIPGSVKEIQTRAFNATGIKDAMFSGTYDEWENVTVGEYNEVLTDHISFSE